MKVKNEIIGDDDNDDEIPEENDGNYSEDNQFLDDDEDRDEDAIVACNVEDFLEKPKEISCIFSLGLQLLLVLAWLFSNHLYVYLI